MLETQKRVGEAAEAIELKQSGENSILGALAGSVGMSLTHVLRWAHWWNSTEAMPDDVSNEQVAIELNTDYSTQGLSANEIIAVVQAWQNGALSRDSMLDIFRRGEVLPEGRTNEEEKALIAQSKPPVVAASDNAAASVHSRTACVTAGTSPMKIVSVAAATSAALVLTVVFVMISLVVDIGCAMLDPRTRR